MTTSQPDGTTTTVVEHPKGNVTATSADGTVTNETLASDPRFGLAAPLRSTTISTPGGLVAALAHGRTASFANPDDPKTLTSQRDDFAINGRKTSLEYTYDSNSKTRVMVIAGPGCNDTDANTPCRKAQASLDSMGRVTGLDPDGPSASKLATMSYGYDPVTGRLVSMTMTSPFAGENPRTYSLGYFTAGTSKLELQTITQPDGQVVTLGYDRALRVNEASIPGQTGAAGKVSSTFDPEGRLATVLTPSGREHKLTYDAVGLPAGYYPPVEGTCVPGEVAAKDTFDLDRKWLGTTAPDGNNIAIGYDAFGRVDKVTTPTRVLQVGYDANGRVTPVVGYVPGSGGTVVPDSRGGALAYTYDGALPLSETWSGGDAQGKVTRVYDSSFRVKDQKLRPCSEQAGCSEQKLMTGRDDFVYDADGLLVGAGALALVRDPNTGLVSGTTLDNVTTTHTYSGFGEPKVFEADGPSSAVYYREEVLGRDGAGRITSKSETIAGSTSSFAYSYWPMGRLKEVRVNGTCTAFYTYDANGNRLSSSCASDVPVMSYDAQDRLKSSDTSSYSYTLSGRLLRKTTGSATTTYLYDALGGLATVVLSDGSRVDYSLDPYGRRIAKRLNGVLVRAWLYEGRLRPVAELDGSGVLRARFVYGVRSNVPEYMINYSSGVEAGRLRFVTDHLGSVRLVVDSTTGVAAQRMDYDVWGQVVADTNPGFQPFGFAGGIWDEDTKLVRFGARDYDSANGRWTTKDPIMFHGGDANLQAYVGNDPINFIDPIGAWGLAVNSGGAAEIGFVTGSGVQANSGLGVFWGDGLNFGGYTASGTTFPFTDPPGVFIAGLTAGLGCGGFLTNANRAEDLLGPFDTWTLNLPIVSLQSRMAEGSGRPVLRSANRGVRP